MKRSKLFFLSLCILAIGFTACNQQPAYYPPAPTVVVQPQVQPGVQMGYQGSDYGAYVTDSRGETYFLLYAMFNNLYAHGGYNSVSSYYYQHPQDPAFRPYQAGQFHASKSADAVAYQARFKQSYQQATTNHTVYTPTAAVVTRNVEIKSKTYGNSYKPSPTNVAVARPAQLRTSSSPTTPSTPTPVVTKPVQFSKPSTPTPSVNLSKASTPAPATRSVSFSRPSSSSSSRSSSGRH